MFADLATALELSATMQREACDEALAFLEGYEARERQRSQELDAAFADIKAAFDQALAALSKAVPA